MAKRHTHILLLAHESARQQLWDMSEGSPTSEIDPRTLRLSPALLRRLEAWFNDVGAKVAPRAQCINVVESDEQITDSLVEGFYIAGDLQRELGHQIVVVYFRNSLEPEVIKTEMEDGNAYSSTDTVEGEAKERGRNGSFDVRSIEAPAWQKVLDLEAQKRALGNDIGAIPTGKWNRLMDRLSMAENQAVREADLVDRLRAAVPDITDPIDREFVYQAIAPLVVWHAEDIETVRDDPRVRLTAEELVGAPALYLAENAAGDLEDIYSWDLEDRWEPDEPFRNLSRIGGAPTQVSDVQPPDDAFLLQIDFRGIPKDQSENPPLLRLLESHGAPADGLLQVFHTTMGDSRTDPGVPGGGATLRYLSEASLARRLPVDMDAECAVYPPSRTSVSFGLGFRNGPVSTDRSAETVVDLQRIADIGARGGCHTVQYESATDPFSATELPVTRLFGMQSYDFDLPDEDVDLLHRELPLAADNHHVLLLNITGDHSFDTVFGDGGRLEIWIRDTDLRAARFDSIVSFTRST